MRRGQRAGARCRPRARASAVPWLMSQGMRVRDDRGHRGYKSVDMVAVRAHAESNLVPGSDGMTPTVPQEVLVAFETRASQDTDGKAAVPPEPLRKGVHH